MRRCAPWFAFCLALGASPAFAQEDPELGITSAQPGTPAPKPTRRRRNGKAAAEPASEPAATTPVDPNAWGATTSADATASSASSDASSGSEWEKPPGFESEGGDESTGDTDHDKIVRHLGIGLLGLAEAPIGVGDPVGLVSGGRTQDPVLTAPVLGARFWFSRRVGLEAGVGFMLRQGKIKQTGGAEVDGAKATMFALSAGLPIAVAYGKHYNLLLIPYAGFATSNATDTRGTAANGDDVFGTGTVLEGGLKGGVEVQLGAIGLEGLALQIAVGVRARLESTNANVPVFDASGMPTGDVDIETSDFVLTTSPGSSLGSAVAGSLGAVYYF